MLAATWNDHVIAWLHVHVGDRQLINGCQPHVSSLRPHIWCMTPMCIYLHDWGARESWNFSCSLVRISWGLCKYEVQLTWGSHALGVSSTWIHGTCMSHVQPIGGHHVGLVWLSCSHHAGIMRMNKIQFCSLVQHLHDKLLSSAQPLHMTTQCPHIKPYLYMGICQNLVKFANIYRMIIEHGCTYIDFIS